MLEIVYNIIINKFISLIKENNILLCHIQQLKILQNSTSEFFNIFNIQITVQKSLCKDIAKRRNEKIRNISMLIYERLQIRINNIFIFRIQHQQLIDVFNEVLSTQNMSGGGGGGVSTQNVEGDMDNDLISDLNEAYR